MTIRFPTFLALITVACGALCGSAVALAAPTQVPVDQFRPTQFGIGRASAMVHYDHWKQEAKQRHMSLKKYARKVLQRDMNEETPVPVVIDPQGHVRNTDAHHHITALLKVEKKTGVAVKLNTRVIADYTGKSEAAYAKDFIGRLKKGVFRPSERNKSDVDKVESLPATYAQMKNDPMRSVVDNAFEHLGLDGKMFSDYVEFRVGDALVEHGLYARLRDKGLIDKGTRSIPDKHVFDKKIVKQVIKLLRTPEMRTVMLDNARDPAMATKIAAALDE